MLDILHNGKSSCICHVEDLRQFWGVFHMHVKHKDEHYGKHTLLGKYVELLSVVVMLHYYAAQTLHLYSVSSKPDNIR